MEIVVICSVNFHIDVSGLRVPLSTHEKKKKNKKIYMQNLPYIAEDIQKSFIQPIDIVHGYKFIFSQTLYVIVSV